MTKITLQDAGSLRNENTFVSRIRANNEVIENISDSFLSRDGTSPNQMEAPLDMNSQRILNLPAPIYDNDPVRFKDVVKYSTEPTKILQTTVAGLPAAASFPSNIVMVSDETGGYVLAFSDGTNWRRVTDRNVVS